MKKIFLSALLALLASSTSHTALAASFPDVSSEHPNYLSITSLTEDGTLKGYPDGTFQPEKTVNRAELLKILVEATGTTPSENEYTKCFPDVQEQWFAPYVCYAKEKEWVGGYPDGTFQPAKTVTKAEAIKMLINSQRLESCNETSASWRAYTWYYPFMCAAAEKNFIEKEYDYYNEEAGLEMSRADISEVVYRAMAIGRTGYRNYDEYYEFVDFANQPGIVKASDGINMLPINLRNNVQWHIELHLGEPEEQGSYYRIKRNYENNLEIEVRWVEYDAMTGKSLAKSSASSGNKLYAYFDGDNLNISEGETCRYEHLHQDCSTRFTVIPTQIVESKVVGTSHYIRSKIPSETIGSENEVEYHVVVVWKREKEFECNIRGVEHHPNDVYYTSDSEKFHKLERFVCFESEETAEQSGFSKAFDN